MHTLLALGLTSSLSSCSLLNGAAGITRSILNVPMGVVRGVTDATPVQEKLYHRIPENSVEILHEPFEFMEPIRIETGRVALLFPQVLDTKLPCSAQSVSFS